MSQINQALLIFYLFILYDMSMLYNTPGETMTVYCKQSQLYCYERAAHDLVENTCSS